MALQTGMAVGIARNGGAQQVATGAEASIEGIKWSFAGGWISGATGTWDVYASADNDTDPYEDTGINVTATDGVKTMLPEEVFNLGGSWIKLVGAVETVWLHGAG